MRGVLKRRLALTSSVAALIAGFSATAAAAAPALPTGGQVAAGQASIARSSASSLTIDQSSGRAIVDWSSFSIGRGGAVQFDNGSGATLNRVTGGDLSNIEGALTATGSVYLINPDGVIVGKSGVVSTGGTFVASTQGLTNASFLTGGTLTFSGNSTASVLNLGKVGSLGGDVALIASRVENDGTITASQGDVGLAAGYQVVMSDAAQNDGKFQVRVGGSGTSATNTGAIQAAEAELRANGGNVYALAGNTGGIIEATGVSSGGGRIWLVAQGGALSVAGALSAQGANGKAGAIETSGETVHLGQATIDAHGGTWLLDPTNLEITAAAASTISSALASSNVVEETTASGDTDGSGGAVTSSGPGNITLDAGATIAWTSGHTLKLQAYNDLILNGSISLAAGTLDLTAGGAIAVNAPVTISGAGAVNLTAAEVMPSTPGESLIELSFASGASIDYGPTDNGGTLSINGQPYTLLYALSEPGSTGLDDGTDDIAGIDNNTAAGGDEGYYALATSLTQPRSIVYDFSLVGLRSTFFGVFEGLGNTIAGLTVHDPFGGRNTQPSQYTDVGLFALNAGTVRDLAIVGGSITLSGSGESFGGYVGAIVAYNNGWVVNCWSSASASGGAYTSVGGIVGANVYGEVGNDFATGTVTGVHADVGGLVGLNYAGLTTNAYANGAVSGGAGASVGGLVGDNSSGTISDSYATGQVTGGSGALLGGLAGGAAGTITNGYYDADTTGQPLGSQANGSVGLSTATLQTSLPVGFSASVWSQPTGSDYPSLLSFQPASNANDYLTGVAYGATGSALSGVTVDFVLNGTTVLGTATTSSDGAYSLTLDKRTLAAGDTVTAYLVDGSTLGDAVAEDIGGGAIVGGFNLYADALSVKTPNTSLSAAEAALADGLGSATTAAGSEILFGYSGGTFSLNAGASLYLAPSGATFVFDTPLTLGTGALVVNAAGALSQSAAITAASLQGSSAGGAAFTDAANQIGVLAGWSDPSGAISLTDAMALQVTGAVSGADVGLTSAGVVSQTTAGTISTAGALDVTSVGGATLDAANQVGTLSLANTGGGAASFSNAGALSVSAATDPGQALTLTTTSGDLTLTGPVTASSVDLVSAFNLSEDGSAAVITTATLTGSAVGGMILVGANQVATLGAFSAARGGLDFKDSQALTIGGAVSSYYGTNLSSNGTITEIGGGAIAGPGGLVDLTSVGGVTFHGTNTVYFLGFTNTGGGAVSFTSAVGLNVFSGSNVGGSVDLATTSGGITFGGPVSAGALTLTSAAGIGEIDSSVITAASLTGTAGGSVTLGDANAIATLGAFTVTGGDFALKDAALTLAGPLTATSVNLTSTSGDVTVSGLVSADTLTLASASGVNETGSGAIDANLLQGSAAGSVSLGGANQLTLLKGFTVTAGDFTLNDDQQLGLSHLLSASGGVTLTSTSRVLESAATGAIDTAGELSVTSTDGLALRGKNRVGSVSLDNGGSVAGTIFFGVGGFRVAGASTSRALTLTDTGGGVIDITGAVSADRTYLRSVGAIEETGAGAVGGGALTVTSVGGDDLTGANTATSLSLVNTGGREASYSSDGALRVTSASNGAKGALTLATTSGALTLSGPVTARTLTLTSAAGVEETVFGVIDAALLRGSAAGSVRLGGGNQIAHLGPFAVSGGDFSLTDAGSLIQSGLLNVGADDVSLTTTNGAISINGRVDAGVLTLDAKAGALAEAPAAGAIVVGTLNATAADGIVLRSPHNSIGAIGTNSPGTGPDRINP